MNGDGMLDVVTAGTSGAVLLGNGDASLAAPIGFAAPGLGSAVALADVNGDGMIDVAMAGDTAVVLVGAGDGTMAQPTNLGSGEIQVGLAIADLIVTVIPTSLPPAR